MSRVTWLFQFQLSQLSKFDLANSQRFNYILKVFSILQIQNGILSHVIDVYFTISTFTTA